MSNKDLRFSRTLQQAGLGEGGFERNLSEHAHIALCSFAIGLSLGCALTLLALKAAG